MTAAAAPQLREELIALPELWSRQCHRTPGNIAIVSEDGPWTYGQLDRRANAFARKVVDQRIGRGSRVGLCVDRSAEAIAAMIGVLKSGAAFVPLDPEFPIERLGYMVDDAGITTIIGHAHYRESVGSQLIRDDASRSTQWIDCEWSWDDDSPSPTSWPPGAPDDLAYVMYTSGSTGRPKGVQIQHSALAAYCFADIDCYQLAERDRTLQFSTLCFDIAIEEIFPPLLCGGSVVIRPRQRPDHRNELSSLVERFDVTALHLATAYWHQWVDLMVASGERIPRSLRLMIATGEKVSVPHYRRWQSLCDHDVLWCNAYGPTEATVSATVYIPEADFDAPNMPIGKPLKRYEAYILDEDRRPVEGSQTGELYIGGPALALGYLNRADLTEAAFIEATLDGRQRRLYRTGDLARWLSDGNIDFAGRIDHQIKLGSYRIEPGEIEAVLDRAPSVLESLVTYDEVDGMKNLIAYVACGSNDISVNELASYLRESLPPYMVPMRYVFLPSFPKTINGKIDRDALPPPSTGVVPRGDTYVPPRDDLERHLIDLWQEVLRVPEVGIHDDFFLLGGSSLLVTQIVTRLISEKRIELPVRDFFANPTVASSARHLRRLLGMGDASVGDDDEAWELRNRLPLVDAEYFLSDGLWLYSVHYRPRSNRRNHAVVLCHSIGHEYARGYRNLQQLAVQLCRGGYDVLRFDYAGTGNSDGDCGELSAERMRCNLNDARRLVAERAGTECVSVIGLRLGATIAAAAAQGSFAKTVLWDPVIHGGALLELLDQLHTRELTSLTRFNKIRERTAMDQCYGHRMTPEKRASIASLRINDSVGQHRDVFVVVTDGAMNSRPQRQWLERQHHVVRVSDTIRWDDARYTESAFSSPASFRAIVGLLDKGM